MPYQRKTRDEWQIHQRTACGWEEVHCESTWKEARERLKEYRANQSAPVKCVKRRVAAPPSYKVSLPRGRWRRGFATVEDASVFAGQVQRRYGIICAVEVDR